MELQQLCNEVCSLAKRTGKYIKAERLKWHNIEVQTKSHNSLVTHVDKKAENKIIEKLQLLLPEAGYIAEEGTNNKTGEVYNWIIDPLDGTTNFIHSLPCFSVSIAL